MEKQPRKNKEILLNVEPKETRVAMLSQGKLSNLIVERNQSRQLTGNIYRGKVTNILRNIQSAFIDIKEDTNGFIHISDIVENAKKFQEMFDLDFEIKDDESQKNADIADLFKKDQPVLVQVVKEAMGTKGARLTSNISLAGRYLVLLPNSPHRGVSRKITDRKVRDKLKKIIKAFEMPEDMGLICRTACIGATNEQLIDEAHDLYRNWQEIVEKFNKADKPKLLFQESDIIKRAVMLAVDKKYDRILIDDSATHTLCKKLYAPYASEHPLKIELYRDKVPMFERFMVEREIDKALRRKVWLQSGGYIIIDRTEAMTTIDVNSGRSKGKGEKSTSNVEENLVRINMEAAVETSRQLRLRNIGGLVICDFIDMRSRKNQRRVLDKLKDAMKEDSARCTVLGMSEFGLVEMTRQRSRESLEQTLFTHCPYCSGSGNIKSHESVAIEIERAMKKLILVQKEYALRIKLHPHVEQYLAPTDKEHLKNLAEELNGAIEFAADDNLHLNDFHFQSSISGEPLEV